jgi:NRAMP (natural resistance-associated macrophage protein)-like metal ion transporter
MPFRDSPAGNSIVRDRGVEMVWHIKRSILWFRRRVWGSLGPGLIAGAADDDPSGIATYSVAGARFGTRLLWTALITWPLMAAVQMTCSRIGMVTGRGLTAAFKKKFPRWLVSVAITALLIANTINVGADLSGMADAAEMLTHISSHIWVVVFALGISWATVRLRYYQIAKTLKWLALVLFSYVIAAFVINPDWAKTLHDTFVPHLPNRREEWETLVAIFGTTISPYLFFWQTTQEVEEVRPARRNTLGSRKGAIDEKIRTRKFDVGTGTFFSNVVMYFIILSTAFTLNRNGQTAIGTSREAASALLPLAGRMATTLYTVGIIGVGLLAIPTLTGSAAYAFAEFRGWRQGLDRRLKQARSFYLIILASTFAAVVMDFTDIGPVQALYWTAVINGLLAPFLLVAILIVASDVKLMSARPSSVLGKIVVAFTACTMLIAAVAMFLV